MRVQSRKAPGSGTSGRSERKTRLIVAVATGGATVYLVYILGMFALEIAS